MKLNRSKHAVKNHASAKLGYIHTQYAFAAELMQKRMFVEADYELKNILKKAPNYDAAKNLLSIVHAHLGNFDTALSLNAELLMKNRTNAQHHFNRGVILYQSGRSTEAITSFERSLKFKNDHEGACLYLGLIFNKYGNLSKSVEFYEKAITINPNNHESFFNSGMLYSAMGNTAKAIEYFEHAIELNLEYSEAFYYLGNELIAQGRVDEALKAYNKTIEIDTDNQMAYFNVGNILYKKGDLSEAISAYEKCLEINSKNDMALLNIGNVYLDRGDVCMALDCYQRCVASTPPSKSYNYVMIGNSLHHKGLNSEAIVAYKKYIAIDSDNVLVNFYLGNVLHEMGNIGEARAAFEATLRLDPFHVGAWTNYALMEYNDGEKIKAKELFDKVIDLDPNNAQANHMLNAINGITPNTAPPSDYIAALFDQYSSNFEEHLIHLAYQAPTLLRKELDLINVDNNKFNNTIDLGCGTGLSGVDFRDITHRLSGVDISPKMIDAAHLKNIYDELTVGNIFSLGSREDRFDLLIAADLFIYIGNLDDVFATVNKISEEKALFLFSVESIPGNSFVLQSSGRFAHSSEYIICTARKRGFSVLKRRSIPLRKGGTGWINGELFILEKD